MKRGYKRLLIFQTILLAVLLLNSFVYNFLSVYGIVVFLITALVFFKVFFGFEKDRQRYTKDIILEVLIALIVFFILYYILGLVVTFARTGNYYNLRGIGLFVVPTILTIILRELLRYMMLKKSEGSILLNITTCLLFILIYISDAIYYRSFDTSYNILLFVAITLLPAISTNVVMTLMSPRTGYKPTILYGLFVGLYTYLMPIIPNPSEYIYSIIMFLLPIIVGYRVYLFYQKDHDEEIDRDYNKQRILSWIPTALIVAVLVYFTSGYFHFYAIAVGSGSMVPNIYRGDVVVIEKIDEKYDKIQEGQVLAYKYNDVIIVHRVVRIIKDKDNYYFYTKGDANEDEDGYVIEENMVIGVVNTRVPFIGYPTVWLSEL